MSGRSLGDRLGAGTAVPESCLRTSRWSLPRRSHSVRMAQTCRQPRFRARPPTAAASPWPGRERPKMQRLWVPSTHRTRRCERGPLAITFEGRQPLGQPRRAGDQLHRKSDTPSAGCGGPSSRRNGDGSDVCSTGLSAPSWPAQVGPSGTLSFSSPGARSRTISLSRIPSTQPDRGG